MSSNRPLATAIRTALVAGAFATLLPAQVAEADGVRFSGRASASVRVGSGGYYARPHRVYRPVRARRFVAQGSLWAGNLYIGWAEPPPPPPPPCPQGCYEPQPTYDPYPPRPPVRPAVVAPAPAPRLAPRLALGAFVGGIDVEEREGGEAFGLIGRLSLGHRLGLEAELSRDQIENDVRTDDRVGAALLFNLMPHRRLNPYLLAGGGVVFTDVADGEYESRAGYAEAGVGLELKLTPRLSVTVEGRAGARRRSQNEPDEMVLRYIAPPANQDESYSRGRLGALLYF